MIVVLGLFHSGTSLLTSVIGTLGVPLCADLNEFYENRMLAEYLRHVWDEPNMAAKEDRPERVEAMRQLVSGGAVKHPLLCMGWRDCREAWPGCRFVGAERPLEQSLHAAGPVYEDGQRKLWRAKQRSPLEFSVRFGDLLANPRMQIDRICYRLGLSPTEQQWADAVSLVRPRPEEPEGFACSQ